MKHHNNIIVILRIGVNLRSLKCSFKNKAFHCNQTTFIKGNFSKMDTITGS